MGASGLAASLSEKGYIQLRCHTVSVTVLLRGSMFVFVFPCWGFELVSQRVPQIRNWDPKSVKKKSKWSPTRSI